MSKFVNLISTETCKNLSLRIVPNKADQITTEQLSKKCEVAAAEYGNSFFDYLSEQFSEQKRKR